MATLAWEPRSESRKLQYPAPLHCEKSPTRGPGLRVGRSITRTYRSTWGSHHRHRHSMHAIRFFPARISQSLPQSPIFWTSPVERRVERRSIKCACSARTKAGCANPIPTSRSLGLTLADAAVADPDQVMLPAMKQRMVILSTPPRPRL
jgi:hypothetical protein